MNKLDNRSITVKGVSVSFGSKQALNNISLSLDNGELYGLLGPNGAGKSTLFRTLTGLLRPASGEIKVQGIDIIHNRIKAQREFVYLPGDVRLYGDLSGQQNLNFLGSLHNYQPSRQAEILERLQFNTSDLNRKVKTYSSGMRQKIAITCAFQHDVPIYILDEPTTGLDPLMQSEFAQLLEGETSRGKTIILSSHTLSEVERVCQHVGIIRNGKMVYDGSLDSLRESLARKLDVVFSNEVPHSRWGSLEGTREVSGTPKHHVITFVGDPKPFLATVADLPVEDISIENASLEEAFKHYYGEKTDV